ncbi:DUF1735 domain-containing protein [Pedobacter endophyticus]|uniref:DUF1735 domain-containing protein n=1 Tax=Pedobacter endophyticus TaxID=2789740 RepID=A0A7U3Q406_9SPHI|nr:DUF1735 domain-containing protein [Pedobacter endophyticus]QPH38143.1 DUF1735 domain-containing protein [Pedobacter endophyticus]
MKKYTYKSLALFLVITSLTSCLKDDSLVLDPKKGHNVIEFANPGQIAINGSIYPLYVLSYEVVPEVSTTVTVSYSGPETEAPEDITVNLALAPSSVIEEYNTKQDKHYELMPTSNYTFNTSSVVIKKGTTKASFDIKFKPNTFDLSKALVLPLKIVSASSGIVSGNFNVILLNVGAKNAYDGIYQYTTSASTSLQPNKNVEVELITQSSTTVGLSPGLLATYSNVVTYTVDPTTLAVTVTCPSLGVQTPQDVRSKYDPTTKTFTVFWKQGNGNRTFEETLVYKRGR